MDEIKQFLSVDFGSGSGYGSGSGSGSGDGSGYGSGSGSGSGDGSGYGYGYGSGYGSGIKTFNGEQVYRIDDMPTIIRTIRGNIAKGFILQTDFTLTPCYIVKDNNKFAHGNTLHDAMMSLNEKLYDDSTEEERIAAFMEKFPSLDTPYSNKELFAYHHVLTGSCRFGRETFCRDNDISLDDSMTIRQFIQLTENSYGGETIKKLKNTYQS